MEIATSQLAPNLFILGAAKSGTTSLYEVLSEHPDIYVPYVKEPQFFSNEKLYSLGLEYYVDMHFRSASEYKYRIDATPHYIYYEKVAQRIKKDIGDNVKFIVILREPVSRAYSLYWNMVREGYEDLSFVEAINSEKERLEILNLADLGTVRFQYIDSGKYAKQIKSYLMHFNINQFLILFQDDLIKEPGSVYKKIGEFLNISGMDKLDYSRKSNTASLPRYRLIHKFLRGSSKFKKLIGILIPHKLKYFIVTKLIAMNLKKDTYQPLDEETRNKLKLLFTKDVIELEELTGKNLEYWK